MAVAPKVTFRLKNYMAYAWRRATPFMLSSLVSLSLGGNGKLGSSWTITRPALHMRLFFVV